MVFSGKEVRVFLKGQAKEAYISLKKRSDKESIAILASFQRLNEILKQNPQYGDPVKKRLQPKNYVKRSIHNIYGAELSHYWRIIYTITGNQEEICVFILNLVDHKRYNKLFGYKKK